MTTKTSTTYSTVSAEASSATRSRVLRFLFGATGIVAFLGWLDTSMLTAIHYAVLPLPEGARVEGTGWEVLTSPWAYMFGIPTSLFGAFYYLMILALVMTWQFRGLPHIERLFLPITAVGVLASAQFVYLQLVVIEAICPFCMLSAGTSTLLFLLALAIYKNSKAPSLFKLGFKDVDAKAIALPIAFVAVPMAALAMLHLVTVLPLPIPK